MLTNCPACRNQLRVQDEFLGRRVRCPTCNAIFEAAVEAPPPPAPPPVPASPQDEIVDYDPAADPAAQEQRRRRRDDYDDHPRRREKPGKVQAIATMTLIGGIMACINGASLLLGLGLGTMGICCLWPGPYFGIVLGIMAIVKGSQLLGQDDWRQPAPRGIAIMQIVNIINLDVANLVMGILTLVFLNEPEVRRYYRG